MTGDLRVIWASNPLMYYENSVMNFLSFSKSFRHKSPLQDMMYMQNLSLGIWREENDEKDLF